ncbi:MAG: DUF305 domain-containing protein [Nitriliruptorales bacterium]
MSSFPLGRRPRLLCVGFVAALIFSACADAQPLAGPQRGGDRTQERSEDFSEADVNFLRGVITHGERLVQLAGPAAERVNRRELGDFARRVATARQEEAARARGLLADADHGENGAGREPWPGAVRDEELQSLQARAGGDFERFVVDLLIRQQLAAVPVAERALEQGRHPRVAAVATQLITGHQADVAQLQAWQQQWWPPFGPVTPRGLGPGDRGPEVLTLEKRLDSLRYDVGQVDGVFDGSTRFAVIAFQKVTGMPRSGRATPDVLARLDSAEVPDPLVRDGGVTRVEIDLPRQVLFLYQGDALFKILPVSSGTGKRYCDKGKCGVAVTPAGAYRVTWRDDGWRESDLGRLYNPIYFIDRLGIAIHGHPVVPPTPASHGCVRIPMAAAEWFPDLVPRHTPVYVLDGGTPVGPLPPRPAD